MRETTIKDVVQSDNWIITKVKQGYRGTIRIDAKTRFYIADGKNRFSKWCSKSYADRLRREIGRKPIEITEY